MRDILFRGKRVDNGEWVYGSLDIYACGIKPPSKIEPLYAVEPDTVGQYTGLTDEKGAKIFEGDIIAFYSEYNEKEVIDGVVKYGSFNCSCCDGVFGWYIDGGDIRDISYKYVIGNIHDNQELLQGNGEA